MGPRPGRGARLLHREARHGGPLRRHAARDGRLPLADRQPGRPGGRRDRPDGGPRRRRSSTRTPRTQVRDLTAKGFAGTVFLTTDDVTPTTRRSRRRGVEFVDAPEERPYGIDSGSATRRATTSGSRRSGATSSGDGARTGRSAPRFVRLRTTAALRDRHHSHPHVARLRWADGGGSRRRARLGKQGRHDADQLMRIDDGRLGLSPSDINTTWPAPPHGARPAPRARRDQAAAHPRPDAELIAERGRRHEAEFLQRLWTRARTSRGSTPTTPSPPPSRRCARAARSSTRPRSRRSAGAASPTSSARRHASALGDVVLRGLRHEAGEAPEAVLHPPAAFYTEQVARLQGRGPERMHVVLGTHETRSLPLARLRRLRARGSACASGDVVAYGDGGAAVPVPGGALRLLRLVGALPRQAPRRRPPLARRHRSAAARRSGWRRAGVRTVARARRPRRRSSRVPRLARATLDGLRSRRGCRSPAAGRPPAARVPPARGRARLLPPARARRPGDVFFDIEGDPYWGDEGLEYLFGSVTRGRRRRYRADVGARPRARSGARSRRGSTGSPSARARPRCTSTTTTTTSRPRSSG